MAKNVEDALSTESTATLPLTPAMDKIRISLSASDKGSDAFLDTISQSRSDMALLYDSIKCKQGPKGLFPSNY
ncbi:hypothetical protein Ciccas_006334 [Cichlidogyrus casuarinus]|uniref:Uncharacterized protein n=1 Tax=Cichlidogyrus casuarinus TaxID=1844966 RepID=A0ABD2Q616_9PLAT